MAETLTTQPEGAYTEKLKVEGQELLAGVKRN